MKLYLLLLFITLNEGFFLLPMKFRFFVTINIRGKMKITLNEI